MKRVLALGLDPAFVELKETPQFTPESRARPSAEAVQRWI
jgi:hypothetical protein